MRYAEYFDKLCIEYARQLDNNGQGIFVWGNTQLGQCFAEYCLQSKLAAPTIIDAKAGGTVAIKYRNGFSTVGSAQVSVVNHESLLEKGPLFVIIAATRSAKEVSAIAAQNGWQFLILADYIDEKDRTDVEFVLRRYKEQRNLAHVLLSFQEYQSDLIVDGIYRNALIVTTAVGCPVKCRYCPQDEFVKAYGLRSNSAVKSLPLADYKAYLKKAPKGTIVSFTGFVEPFVNPECLHMIRHTLDSGYKVRVFSTMYNQSIADYEQFAHHENLKTFDLHLPDTDGNTVFPITRQYRELLQHITTHKPKYARFWTSCLGVGTKVIDAVRDIIDVTPNAVNSIHGLVYDNGLNHGGAKLSCKYDCSRIDDPKAGIVMMLPNGDITVCTQDWELKHVMGNIADFNDWESILNAPKRIKFRDGMSDSGIESICRTCELAIKVAASDVN